MQTDLHKRAVRAAFGNAATRYDTVAHVQRRIADVLLSKCAKTSGMALDAGSGTGYARETLHALSASCAALDHAAPMLLQAGSDGVCGDIEALPLHAACIALYYSSLAWQWTDATRSIGEAARVLQPGGQLVVATLGPGTLSELRAAFAQADDAEHVRRFVSADSYAPQLAAAGFKDIEISVASFVAHAPGFRGLLHEIKTLGAHVMTDRPRGLFGIQRFRRAEDYYESLRETPGLPVTYEAVFITARRA
ncbi:MAG TPA: methyltransferase domain-containing protein [Rhodocyclaceae bacterium]|nr:methyltransferase domain-containing protein [Rhodocyclaceae bacterium]